MSKYSNSKISHHQSRAHMMGFLLAVMGFSGCTTGLILSEEPASIAPKLQFSGMRDDMNRLLTRWDRPQAFGKLRPEKIVAGDAACLIASSDLMAIGYHPLAENLEGRPLIGGGFLCSKKPQLDKPEVVPPKLVMSKGVQGWDRPRAFGRVPDEEVLRGDRICQQMGSNFKAVGFHPHAMNEQGQSIAGGGFFCGVPVTAQLP